MNKKIAVVTIYDELNYGNRLQNYAVTKTFEKMGGSVQTIVAQKPKTVKEIIKLKIKQILPIICKSAVRRKFPAVLREYNFRNFTKKHIPTVYIKTNAGTLPVKTVDQYDCFVVGSDQVWNPCFGGFEAIFDDRLLTFVPSNKKMCFSPSFGVSQLPKEWEVKFAKALSDFPKLSVREESGAKIIRDLLQKEAEVLIDPTLMLDAEEWLEVSKKVSGLDEHYVLDYFLGATPKEDEMYESALAKVGAKRHVRLLDITDKSIYVSGPAEFIYLISKASLVCTDSFHACVFSILFSKPFIIFKRKDSNNDMFSRMETLLGIFNVDLNQNIGKTIVIDPEIRDKVLKEKREQVENFLNM